MKEHDVTFFNGVKWNLTVTRNMSFWHQCLSNYGLYHHNKDFGINAPIEALFIEVDGTKCSWFTNSENFKKYSDMVMLAVDSMEKIKKLKKNYEQFGNELLNSLQLVKSELNLRNWNAFIQAYRKYCSGLTITTVIGRRGSDLLMEKIRLCGVEEKEIPEIISLITYPEEHTPLLDSQLSLLRIGEKVQSGKLEDTRKNKELSNWVNAYGHIPVNFCDDPWSLEDASKQLSELLDLDCKSELAKFKKDREEKIRKSKKILSNFKDDSIKVLAHAIAEGTYLNEYRKNIFSKVSLEYRNLFSKIAKLGGSNNWRDCFYLTPEETGMLVEGKKIDIGSLVGARRIFGAYTTSKGEIKLLPNKVIESFYGYVLETQGQGNNSAEAEIKEIKGFSANRGIVRGIARIILNSKDFERLRHNDILVTTMTSVDFVPVMKRASAFVTNEGGITSHASIVAREMNKPCIIGTKIATKALKDGDLIEVDADKGLVKIIERAK